MLDVGLCVDCASKRLGRHKLFRAADHVVSRKTTQASAGGIRAALRVKQELLLCIFLRIAVLTYPNRAQTMGDRDSGLAKYVETWKLRRRCR